MANSLLDRVRSAWASFLTPELQNGFFYNGSTERPDRPRLRLNNERTIISSIYTRIAMDCASITIAHVKLNADGKYQNEVSSKLNKCLTLSPNLDQTARSFVLDLIMTLLDEGSVAIVPIESDGDLDTKIDFDPSLLRIGRIIDWYPKHVKVEVYNEDTGYRQEIVVPKSITAIIQSPLYSILNEPNSTMNRLIRKLRILDVVDEQSGSGKLDIIIQLPYTIKTKARREQAELRRQDIEQQLAGSKYGVAYTDGAEKITQLNRPSENNLMAQVEYLTRMLFSQLGITQGILDGTADDATMNNYYNRVIELLLSFICDELKRKYLSEEDLEDGESIMFFRDPLKLIPVNLLADIAETFLESEILSPNDFREIIGRKPSTDPASDELRNRKLSRTSEEILTNNSRKEIEEPDEQSKQTI